MKHIKKFNETLSFTDFKGSDLLISKLDEAYEILREQLKSYEVEDFYQSEEIIEMIVMNHLKDKLWNDKDLEDWMRKREFGEE